MPEEEQNSSAARRAARRSVWEQARAAGTPKDETPPPAPNSSAAMRAARRSVWEQARAAGTPKDETPPPAPTGRETGLDDPRIPTLEGIVRDLAGRLDDLEDDFPEPESNFGSAADVDYAFKITAVENLDGNGDPYDPPQFTVKVLGGPAQTLGGSPHLYEDTEIPSVVDGDYICVKYYNVDANYIEVGDWDADIHAWDADTIESYYSPQNLVFVLGRVGKAYSSNVRQDHKGGIVMPAISNVVDIQTQLP